MSDLSPTHRWSRKGQVVLLGERIGISITEG